VTKLSTAFEIPLLFFSLRSRRQFLANFAVRILTSKSVRNRKGRRGSLPGFTIIWLEFPGTDKSGVQMKFTATFFGTRKAIAAVRPKVSKTQARRIMEALW
jgi:hypothetical protein